MHRLRRFAIGASLFGVASTLRRFLFGVASTLRRFLISGFQPDGDAMPCVSTFVHSRIRAFVPSRIRAVSWDG